MISHLYRTVVNEPHLQVMHCAKSGLSKQAETLRFALTVAAMKTRPYGGTMVTLGHQHMVLSRQRCLRIDDAQWAALQLEEVASKCSA
jgi:hypothetical protein